MKTFAYKMLMVGGWLGLLNLSVIAAIFFIGWLFVPDAVVVTLRPSADYTLTLMFADSETNVWRSVTGHVDSGRVFKKIVLPESYKIDNLLFKFKSQGECVRVEDITFLKFGFIRRSFNLKAVKVYSRGHEFENFEQDELVVPCGRSECLISCNGFSSCSIDTKKLLVFEVVLLGLSIFLALVPRGRTRMLLGFCMLISTAAALFWGIVVPAQTYLSNQNMFQYSFGDILVELAVAACVIWIFVFMFCLIGVKRFPLAVPSIVLACVVYSYFHIAIFTAGAPEINGNLEYYESLPRMIFDVVAGGLLIAGFIMFRRLVTAYGTWIVASLIVLSLAFWCDARVTEKQDGQSDNVSRISQRDVVSAAGFSSNRNVFVFVWDCVSGNLAIDALHEAKLEGSYLGFVAYTNNVGMHSYTLLGSPSLVTGRYYDENEYGEGVPAERRFAETAFGSESFITPYVNAGYPVFAIFGFNTSVGIAYKPLNHQSTHLFVNVSEVYLKQRCGEQQNWNLAEISAFRLAPFLLKSFLYRKFALWWLASETMDNEKLLYATLSSAPISDVACTLHTYHTYGAHPPYSTDRDGNPLSKGLSNYQCARERTIYAMSALSAFLETLKAKGLYDRSTIIVCSDHGNEFAGDVPFRAFPMLWIKPSESGRERFRISGLSTSHSKVSSVVKNLCHKDLTLPEMERILFTSKRIYKPVRTGGASQSIYEIGPRGEVTLGR